MGIRLDLSADGYLTTLNKIIKKSAELTKEIKGNDKSTKDLEKEIKSTSKEFAEYGKKMGMTSGQIKSMTRALKEQLKVSREDATAFGRASIQYKKSAASLGEYRREINGLVIAKQKLIEETKKSEKQNRIYNMTLVDMVKHAQRLIRYYVLLQGAILLYKQTLSVFTEGAKFEMSLKTLQGVTRSVPADLEKVTLEIRKLGGSTEWTAIEIANAAKFLGMAGFNLDQIRGSLKGVVDLATAGQVDLAAAADIATNIMTAFGLQVSELGRVNDVLIGVITRTNSTIIEMSEAMKYAAPVAKSFGYEIEEVAAMLGILHNAGIKGSMAGTNLARAIFKAEDAFKKFGHLANNDLFAEASKGVGRLTDAITLMRKAGYSSSEIIKSFGDRGAKAALIFMDLQAELETLTDRLKDVTGESSNLSNIMRSSLTNEFEKFKSAISQIRLDLFNKYLPTVIKALIDLTNWISLNRQNIVRWTANLVTAFGYIKTFVVYFTVGAAAGLFIKITNGLLTATYAAKGFTGAMVAMRIALAAHPILLIASAVAGIATVFYMFRDNTLDTVHAIDEQTDSVDALTEAMKNKDAIDRKNLERRKEEIKLEMIRININRDRIKEEEFKVDTSSNESTTKSTLRQLQALDESGAILGKEIDQLNLFVKQRKHLFSLLEKTNEEVYQSRLKDLQREERILENTKLNYFALRANQLEQIKLTKEFNEDMAKLHELDYKYGHNQSDADAAIFHYKIYLDKSFEMGKITEIQKNEMIKLYTEKLYKWKSDEREKERKEIEKYNKKIAKDQEDSFKKAESLLLNNKKDLSSEGQNLLGELLIKEKLLDIDEAIYSMESASIDIIETIADYSENEREVLSDQLSLLNKKLKILRDLRKQTENKEWDNEDWMKDDLSFDQLEIDEAMDSMLEKEKERIELMEEYNEQLVMAAANIAAMAVESADFDEIMKAALVALGTYAGQVIGSAYGGPAGGAVGGAIGGAVGGALGDMINGGDNNDPLRDQLNALSDAFDSLIKSMEEYDETLRRSELSYQEKLEEYISGMDTVIEKKNEYDQSIIDEQEAKDIYDEFRKIFISTEDPRYDEHQRKLSELYEEYRKQIDLQVKLQTEINQILDDIEEFRQAILNAAKAARDLIKSVEESKSKYKTDRLKSSGLYSYENKHAMDVSKEKSLLSKLENEQYRLVTFFTKGTDEYKQQETRVALAQIEYADAVEQSWESEKELIEHFESLGSTLENLIDSLDSMRNSLKEGALNPDQSFKWAQEHYEELRSKAMSSGSNADIQEYQNYINTYLEKAREQYGSTAEYARIFDDVVDIDIVDVQQKLLEAVERNTEALQNTTVAYMDAIKEGAGIMPGKPGASNPGSYHYPDGYVGDGYTGGIPSRSFAGGGISDGPLSGYTALLHGEEAVIPLKNGSVPVNVHGDLSNKQVIDLLNELIFVTQEGKKIYVEVDGGQLNSRIRKEADRNRVDADNQGMKNQRMIY